MKRYIVFLKQVPQSTRVEIDPITKTLKRSSALCKTNPDDLCALQAALNLKKKTGAEIVAVSMGPAKAENVLREALQHGADRAILLSSHAFAGSDTWCTKERTFLPRNSRRRNRRTAYRLRYGMADEYHDEGFHQPGRSGNQVVH